MKRQRCPVPPAPRPVAVSGALSKTAGNGQSAGLTCQQRRAYIDTSRRSQPLAELERKAMKARRRRPWSTPEAADLSLAKGARFNRPPEWGISAWCPINFCCLCSEFGRGGWNERTKRFEVPIQHKPRCWYGGDDSPYPGWSAVSSPVELRR